MSSGPPGPSEPRSQARWGGSSGTVVSARDRAPPGQAQQQQQQQALVATWAPYAPVLAYTAPTAILPPGPYHPGSPFYPGGQQVPQQFYAQQHSPSFWSGPGWPGQHFGHAQQHQPGEHEGVPSLHSP